MKCLNFLLILFLLICISCRKEENTDSNSEITIECSDEIILLEDAFFDDNSRQFVPYDSMSTIYFTNKYGEEVSFISHITHIGESFLLNFRTQIACSLDQVNTYQYDRQTLTKSFKCSELDLSIMINLGPIMSGTNLSFYDELTMLIFAPHTNGVFQDLNILSIVTSTKGNDIKVKENYFFLNELTLNQKAFKNVYANIKGNNEPLTDLYYNYEFGVIGFTDMENKLWVFDRAE